MGSKFSSIFLLLTYSLLAACGSPEERAANYLAEAQALYDQGDYVTARIEAMNAAQIEPRNADVRFLLANIEEHENNLRKAVGHLQVAIDADPNHLESRIKLGNYYILARAGDLASEQAAAAAELAPDDAAVRLLQARVNLLNEDTAAAKINVEAALAVDPTLVDAIMFKAVLNMMENDTEGAMQLVQDGIGVADEQGIKLLRQFRIVLLRSAERFEEMESDLKTLARDYPEEESFPLTLAQLYVKQERIDEAEEIFRAYVAQAPQDTQRRIEFTRFIGSQHGPEAAEEALLEYVAEIPESMELLQALGQLYEATKQQDKALETYAQVASTEPKSPLGLASRNRIAAIKLQQNKPEEARETVAAILADDQDNPDALMIRAAFAFAEKRFDDSVTSLRTVLRVKPEFEPALLLLARAHKSANNRELAQDAYRRLIELNPSHSSASAELAEMLARSGDVPMAEEVLRDQLAADPQDQRAASSLIQALLLQGDVEGAETQARSMLDFGDESGLAEFQLGRVLQAKKSNQEAIDAYQAALEKSPDAAEPLQGLVTILVNDGRSDEAAAYLLARLDQYPTQLAPRLLLAAVYANEGKTEAAAEQYEEVISLKPDGNRTYASLAGLYPDDPARRISIYQRGLDANPNNLALNLLLATEFERVGQVEDAINIYNSVLEENENNAIAANNLAALMLDYRTDAASHARALELAKAFENSKQAALLDTLGWAYYKNREYNDAIRLLEAAVAADDNLPLLHYHLGMAFVKADMSQRGREALEKSLAAAESEFPGIDEARATLEQLPN